MSQEINQKRTEHAQKILGVSIEHEICFLANTEISFIRDHDLVMDGLKDADGEIDIMLFNEDCLLMALDEASVSVKLPGNLRVVGMAKPNSDDRVYGVVDFTGFI